jgi:hypothetical protein
MPKTKKERFEGELLVGHKGAAPSSIRALQDGQDIQDVFSILFILLIPVYFFSTCRRKTLGGLVFTVTDGVEVPFDPEEKWAISPRALWPGRRGHAVTG